MTLLRFIVFSTTLLCSGFGAYFPVPFINLTLISSRIDIILHLLLRDGERIDLCSYAQCTETNCECKSAIHCVGPLSDKSDSVTLQLHAGCYHDVYTDLVKVLQTKILI